MQLLRQLIQEVHRRSLWQVLGIYLVGGWVAYEVVQGLTEGLGLPGWFPAFAIVLLIIGLPIVLATAFVQEGIPKSEIGEHETASHQAPRAASAMLTWRNALAGGVMAFALWGVVAAAWLTFGAGGGPPTVHQSIAVLPFEDLSPEGDQKYFVEGLSEEIINALTGIRDLKVSARTSTFLLAEQNVDIATIATQLGVANVLEGSVRKSGERIRITAQLIEAGSGFHLWSETFDRELTDIFTIQDEIARAITSHLQITLSGGAPDAFVTAATDNPEAYDLYLRGREYWDRPFWERENFEAAIELYERAVSLDPDFALAHAALSVVHSAMSWGGYGGYDQSPERLAAAEEHALEALRLQPGLAEAHLAMGYVHYWGRFDLGRGLEEFEIAQRIQPNSVEIMEARGFVHRRLGQWDTVIAIFEAATSLDPQHHDLFQNLGGLTFQTIGRYGDAISATARAVELAPDQNGWRVGLALYRVYGEGQLDSLRATAARLTAGTVATGARRQLALFERDHEEMLRLVAEAPAPDPLYAAWAHRLRGDDAAALAGFDSARVQLESRVSAQLDGPRPTGPARGSGVPLDLDNLGFAYGGLGRVEEAAALAQRILEWNYGDEYMTLRNRARAAHVLAQAGRANEAVDLLEALSETPHRTTIHALRLDPMWDPIREHPRFVALLQMER